MQVICRVKAPFSLCGDREEFAIAKSCRDAEIFVFAMGGLSQQVDFTMGGLSQRMDIAKGGHRNGANRADVRILGGSAGSNV